MYIKFYAGIKNNKKSPAYNIHEEGLHLSVNILIHCHYCHSLLN